jgi:hypothetical protein
VSQGISISPEQIENATELNYIYYGHGNPDRPSQSTRACLTCNSGQCQQITLLLNSCSSFATEQDFIYFTEYIQDSLDPEDVVTIHAEQNYGFEGSEDHGLDNPIIIVLHGGEIQVDYPLCSTLGLQSTDGTRWCGPVGSVSKCIDDDTQEVSQQICCPIVPGTVPDSGVGEFIEAGDDGLLCPEYCSFPQAGCTAALVPPEHLGVSDAVCKSEAVTSQMTEDLQSCLEQRAAQCESIGGFAAQTPYHFPESYFSVEEGGGRCIARYSPSCHAAC